MNSNHILYLAGYTTIAIYGCAGAYCYAKTKIAPTITERRNYDSLLTTWLLWTLPVIWPAVKIMEYANNELRLQALKQAVQ
jgi:hypothetical protein